MSETQNPNDSILPDPLLEPGSFIEPNGPCAGPKSAPEAVIAAQPLSIVSPDGTPISVRTMSSSSSHHARRNAEEMAKRPEWLPEDWRIELRIRSSGATAGQIDRYYVETTTGFKFRSKTEVLHYMETGTKQKKRKFVPEGEPGSSGRTTNGKQKTSVEPKISSSVLKSDNKVTPTTCL